MRWRSWLAPPTAVCATASPCSSRPAPTAAKRLAKRRCANCWASPAERCSTELVGAIEARSAQRALALVHRLLAEGQNLQQFCREAIGHFRNLLVTRVCGADSDLIAAPPEEHPRLARAAAAFSEEDLTRCFQILLQTDDDLRRKPDPRLHLEMGLLRLVNAAQARPARRSDRRTFRQPHAAPATADRDQRAPHHRSTSGQAAPSIGAPVAPSPAQAAAPAAKTTSSAATTITPSPTPQAQAMAARAAATTNATASPAPADRSTVPAAPSEPAAATVTPLPAASATGAASASSIDATQVAAIKSQIAAEKNSSLNWSKTHIAGNSKVAKFVSTSPPRAARLPNCCKAANRWRSCAQSPVVCWASRCASVLNWKPGHR